MSTNDTLQLLIRLIAERHSQLNSALVSLFRVLAGEDAASKLAHAQGALRAANDLKVCLSNKDIPSWLVNAIQSLTSYTNKHWSSYQLLENLILIKREIENHRWIFQEGDDATLNFDSIYEHFKKESRLPELFDEIVKILESIKESGEVDSVTMLRALGKVTATIQRGRDGSYFCISSAWDFLLSFLKNYMWGELTKLPGLGTALEALRKAIEETNDEMYKLHQSIDNEMRRTVESEVKALKDKSSFAFIGYDKGGYLLPPATSQNISNMQA